MSPLKCRVWAKVRVNFSGHGPINTLGLGFVPQTYGPRLRIRAKIRKITKT